MNVYNDTEFPACVSGTCRQGRLPCPTPNACRYAAMHPAHAASEIDDEPPVEHTKWDGPIGILLLAMSAVAVVIIGVHLVARVLS